MLVKVLTEDHFDQRPEAQRLRHQEQDERDTADDFVSAPSPITLFERVFDRVERLQDRNREQWVKGRDAAGGDENAVAPGPRVAGDLFVALAQLRDVLAKALDTADRIHDIQSERSLGEI